MVRNFLISSVVLVELLSCAVLTRSFTYHLEFDDENFIKPCKNEPNKFITTFFDMSNLTFKSVSDEEIIVNGDLKSIAPIESTDKLYFHFDLYKEVRGQYQKPMIEIKREDFCASLFNPAEIWYSFSRTLDENYRICPPTPGVFYRLNNWSTRSPHINLPDPGLTGAYRYKMILGKLGDEEKHFCITVDFHLYKGA